MRRSAWACPVQLALPGFPPSCARRRAPPPKGRPPPGVPGRQLVLQLSPGRPPPERTPRVRQEGLFPTALEPAIMAAALVDLCGSSVLGARGFIAEMDDTLVWLEQRELS